MNYIESQEWVNKNCKFAQQSPAPVANPISSPPVVSNPAQQPQKVIQPWEAKTQRLATYLQGVRLQNPQYQKYVEQAYSNFAYYQNGNNPIKNFQDAKWNLNNLVNSIQPTDPDVGQKPALQGALQTATEICQSYR